MEVPAEPVRGSLAWYRKYFGSTINLADLLVTSKQTATKGTSQAATENQTEEFC